MTPLYKLATQIHDDLIYYYDRYKQNVSAVRIRRLKDRIDIVPCDTMNSDHVISYWNLITKLNGQPINRRLIEDQLWNFYFRSLENRLFLDSMDNAFTFKKDLSERCLNNLSTRRKARCIRLQYNNEAIEFFKINEPTMLEFRSKNVLLYYDVITEYNGRYVPDDHVKEQIYIFLKRCCENYLPVFYEPYAQ